MSGRSGAGGDVYAVAVVLMVGTEGVGKIEVVYGVYGEVDKRFFNAVGSKYLPYYVLARGEEG